MNREIKFRAWWKNNSEPKMIEPASLPYLIWQQTSTFTLKMLEEEFIFMGYTGLKDKNGVEIYEGDIIKDLLNNKIGKIQFKIDICGFEISFKKDNWDYIFPKTLEIIGNIYENPELIKE